MELRWLQAFVAVAEELHFGRAAERLGTDNSPLSQTVRRLERELDVELFDRTTRSVALTSAGHALLPHARTVLAELELGRRATEAPSAVYGRVAIAFSGAHNHLTLPVLTRHVRAALPHVELVLDPHGHTGAAVRRLLRGDADLAFVGLPVAIEGLAVRPITEDAIGVVVATDHPFAAARTVRLADAADEPLVVPPAADGSILREMLLRAARAAGHEPRVVQEVADPFTVLALVAGGMGVTLAPGCVASILPAGAVFRPLAPAATSVTALAWRADDVSPALRAVLAAAEEALPTPPGLG